MKKFLLAFVMLTLCISPAYALGGKTGLTNELEFVTDTIISGENGTQLALCYRTRTLRVFGYVLLSNVQDYMLSSDRCQTATRTISPGQIKSAQSLSLISADVPPVARNDFDRNLMTYGIIAVIALGLFAVIWRRMRSILGYDPDGPMRQKAAQRVVDVMCHAANCDGLVGAQELLIINRTAQRLTRRNFPAADLIKYADQISADLTTADFEAFGQGLREREKRAMLHGALRVVAAGGRVHRSEYAFVTTLAQALGIPGDEFRRAFDAVLADLDKGDIKP